MYEVNQDTGEVIEMDYEERALVPVHPALALEAANISSIINAPEPEHLIALKAMDMEPEEALELLSIYEGANWRKFSKFTNETVTLLGAIVHYHPPFKSKPDANGKSEIMAGYHKILFLTDKIDEDGIPVVIAASSSSLAMHVKAMLDVRGWYLWKQPTRYKFLYDGPGTPYRMINMDRVDRMQQTLQNLKGNKK